MTDWSKAFEVFFSGIMGVYLIMGVLMVLTQIGLKAINLFENWKNEPASEEK